MICEVCKAVAEKMCYCCRWCTEEQVCDNCVQKSLFETEMQKCPQCGRTWAERAEEPHESEY